MIALTHNQFKKLEGLWFWMRELRFSLNANDDAAHIEGVHKNISMLIDECDKLNIPFTTQNAVLCHSDVYDDIRDIFKNNKIQYKTY